MAHRSASVGSLFVVRWGVPDSSDLARLGSALALAREQNERGLFYVGVMPHDTPALSDRERSLLTELTEAVLPHCARLAVAIEARGFRGAILRSAMTKVSSLTQHRDIFKIVDSLDSALSWAPNPVPPGSLELALKEIGCPFPPSLRVA